MLNYFSNPTISMRIFTAQLRCSEGSPPDKNSLTLARCFRVKHLKNNEKKIAVFILTGSNLLEFLQYEIFI